MTVAILGTGNCTSKIDNYIPLEATRLVVTVGDFTNDLKEFAKRNTVPIEVIRPQYKKYGEAAAIACCEELVRQADMVVAVWDGKPGEVSFAVQYAQLLGKCLWVYQLPD